MKVKHVRRKLLFFALAVICFAVLSSGTLAYFNAADTAHNVITSGKIDIQLEEWADAARTQPFSNVSGITPGEKVTKIVTVRNTGTADAWVRVSVIPKITLYPSTGTPDPSLLHMDYNTAAWTDGGDGYWYYNTRLAPGDVTEPLFTSVTFDVDMGNLYQSSSAAVAVSAQAVQSDNNGQTPAAAAGWPE